MAAFANQEIDFNLDDYGNARFEFLSKHDTIVVLYECVVLNVLDEDFFWMRKFFARYVLGQGEVLCHLLLANTKSGDALDRDDNKGF